MSASSHAKRSAGTASSDMRALRSLIQAWRFLRAHLLLLLVFAGTTPFAASLISSHVTDKKPSWIGFRFFRRLKRSHFLLVVLSISQLVAQLFFPTWLSLADDDWVMKNSVIPRSKLGSWQKVLYFLENCWRNNGTENHHPCFSSASMIQIAVLDTHSNTMATVQNCDITQEQFSY